MRSRRGAAAAASGTFELGVCRYDEGGGNDDKCRQDTEAGSSHDANSTSPPGYNARRPHWLRGCDRAPALMAGTAVSGPHRDTGDAA